MKRCFSGPARYAVVAVLSFPAGIHPQIPAPSVTPVAQASLPPELRGDLAMARQQYLAAIDAYRDAPQDSPVVWNKIGMAYHHLFAVDEARRDYQHALHLRPNYPEALNNLGAIYYAKKDYRRAIRFYRRALQLDPQSAPIYSNLGTAYFAQRKVAQGIAAYQSAFAINPRIFEESSQQLVNESLPPHDRAQQDYCLASLFAQSGHREQAIEYLRKALNEGFDDKKKLLDDQNLASLRSMPEFATLMTEEKVR